jgi:hypothetical protein
LGAEVQPAVIVKDNHHSGFYVSAFGGIKIFGAISARQKYIFGRQVARY